MQFGPTLNHLSALVEELPAQRTRQAESTVIRRAAPDADETAACTHRVRGRNDCSQTEGVQIERMVLARRQTSEAVRLSCFDDGRARFWFPPPMGCAWFVRGVNGANCFRPRAETCSNQFAKAVSTIADWKHRDKVGWSHLPPTSRHGVGSGARGKRAFEFIGSNENVHAFGVSAQGTPLGNRLFRIWRANRSFAKKESRIAKNCHDCFESCSDSNVAMLERPKEQFRFIRWVRCGGSLKDDFCVSSSVHLRAIFSATAASRRASNFEGRCFR